MNKTTCSIVLDRTNRDLGPPLQSRVILNDEVLDQFGLENETDHEYEINVKNNDNYLYIEHFGRHNTNTQVDNNGNIIRSSCLIVKDIKINRVKFHVSSVINKKNKFLPAYDDSYIQWMKRHRPENNLDDEVDASSIIGINGKLRLHFVWPLHLHGLHFFNYLQ